MKTVFIYDLFFIFYAFCIHLTTAEEDKRPKVKNFNEFRNVLELLEVGKEKLKLSENNLQSKDIYKAITDDSNKINVVFDELKKEFDVASCIFKGVALSNKIENAAIYLHTTKYLFTSLRYSLDLFSKYKLAGKMEKELAPFAFVLNSVLLHGTSDKVSAITYSGENFMCELLFKEVRDKDIIFFHTFMPSSTNLKIAMEYAAKKGDSSCIYIFKNTESQYSPRNIRKLSYEPNDEEAVFPIGAAFRKITCTLDDETIKTIEGKDFVCLELLPDQERPKTLNLQDKTCKQP